MNQIILSYLKLYQRQIKEIRRGIAEDVYPITAVPVESLQSKLSHRINLERYDYFLSCHGDSI